MDISTLLHTILVAGIPLIFAITLHEAAHAWMAKVMGDKTAYNLGRVTLNPVPHVDPLGTLVLPGLCLALGAPVFGWAKPVPIDPGKMRYPKKSPFWVAAAGPVSNFLMALIWAVIGWVTFNGFLGSWASRPLFEVAQMGIQINLVLMIFNLLPFPPLDGSRLVERFLKGKALNFWHQLEQYGMYIVLILAMTPILSTFWLKPWLGVFSWVFEIQMI